MATASASTSTSTSTSTSNSATPTPGTSATPTESPRRDRRHLRHEATKEEIVDKAWQMVRVEGLNALSLRALARAVDMEPQSLYTYFSSKHAVYDRLFLDANTELLARFDQIEVGSAPEDILRAIARLFVTFATEDGARYQLLFQRTIPDFEPSADSYAVAIAVFAKARALLEAVGLNRGSDFDLWTALVAGLASQQLANDREGDRYLLLIDEAVSMFAKHVFGNR